MLGVVLVSLMVSACGSGGSAADTPQPVVTVTVTTGPHTPSPESTTSDLMPKGNLGDTLTLSGLDNSKVEVTVSKTKRVPKKSESGYEIHPALYGVYVWVKNVSDAPYTDYAGAVSLVDEADSTYDNPQSYNDLPVQLTELQIAPGDKRSGWVYFEVPESRTPRIAQFTANSMNVDYSLTQIGEWSLQ